MKDFPAAYQSTAGSALDVDKAFYRRIAEDTAGRRLVLGGVVIEHPTGLVGHSDGDVLLHAVMDAVLGAANLGDLGSHFPSDDPRFAGADSQELLRQVGIRLSIVVRASDTVARLSGDEFAVLLPGADLAGAQHVAAALLHALDVPVDLEGQALGVSASIGIALCPAHGEDADMLLRRADVAMYVAKRAGGGCTTYAPELDRLRPAA